MVSPRRTRDTRAMARSDPTIYALLMRAHSIAHRVAADMLFENGVSPLEAWVLEEIPEDGRACASELAAALEVPTSTVTRALRRMERWGYVRLTKGFFLDARVLRPQLTREGMAVRNSALGFERAVDARVLEGIQPGALAGLLAGLIHLEREAERLLSGEPKQTAAEP